MTKTRNVQQSNPRVASSSRTRPRVAWHGATILAGAALVAMVFAAYAPVLGDNFIWDDDAYVTRNPTLRSLDGLRMMWFEPRSLPQYYPLVHTTFWIEYHLWELAPLGYHADNVLLHAASVILLWRLLVLLRVPGAWLAAAIFAVHPVMVESVCWITERKNVLSLAFALLSMHCYLRFAPAEDLAAEDVDAPRSAGRWRWYAAALVLFVAALLSKTVVATMPAVLLVIYWWKRGRIAWRDIPPLLPFFLVGVGMGLYTARLERIHVGAVGEEWSFTPLDRVLIAGRAPWFYASKLVWPYPLIFFYPRWDIDEHAWWQYVFPMASLAAIVALWFSRKWIGRGPLAAALIFVGVLFPALGFLNVYPFRYSFVADHFQYHASLALITLTAAIAATAAAWLRTSQRGAAKFAAAAVLVLLAALTCRQTYVYENLETLWRDVITRNPKGWFAHTNLALHLATRGRSEEAVELARESAELAPHEPPTLSNLSAILLDLGNRDGFKPGQLDEIIAILETALKINPRHVPSYSNLGLALTFSDRPEEALSAFNSALEIAPGNPRALYGMGMVAESLGRSDEARRCYEQALARDPDEPRANHNLALILMAQGEIDEAIRHSQVAVRVQPFFGEAHYALGVALTQRGDREGTAQHFAAAVQMRPTDVRALVNLGIAQTNLSDFDNAIYSFKRAIALAPRNVEAEHGLGVAYRMQGNPSEAIRHMTKAFELDPNRVEICLALAAIFVGQNDFRQAARYYAAAVRLQPTNVHALADLGAALLQLGEIDQAVPYLTEALRLEPNNANIRRNLEGARLLKQRRSD